MIRRRIVPAKLTTPGPLELQQYFAQMVARKVTHAAMEVSSIAVDQARTAGTNFDVGLFTNFTQDHLDYHGTFERYFQAKLKFFEEYPLNTAILNIDDTWVRKVLTVKGPKNFISFSLENSKADFFAKSVELLPHLTRADIQTPSGIIRFESVLVGRHNLYNSIGVLAAAFASGIDLKEAIVAFQSLQGAPGRLERVMTGKEFPTVLVDYAHTDDALKNVLSAVRHLQKQSGKGE